MINDLKNYLNPLLEVLKDSISVQLFQVYLTGLIQEDKYFSVQGIAQKSSVEAYEMYDFLKSYINWSTILYALVKMIYPDESWQFVIDSSPLKQVFSKYRITKKALVPIERIKNVPHNELVSIILTNGTIRIVVDFRIWISQKVCNPCDYRTKTQLAFDMMKKVEQKKIPVNKIVFDSGFFNKCFITWLEKKNYLWEARIKKNTSIQITTGTVRVDSLNIKKDVKYLLKMKGRTDHIVISRLEVNNKEIFMATNDLKRTPQEIDRVRRLRWGIETYHRDGKQLLGLENFQFKNYRSLKNHVGFCCLAFSLLNGIKKSDKDTTGSIKRKIQNELYQRSRIIDLFIQKLAA